MRQLKQSKGIKVEDRMVVTRGQERGTWGAETNPRLVMAEPQRVRREREEGG